MSDVTQVLLQIEQGDPAAAEQLLPLVYDELRKLAAAKLTLEKPGQTLQATALVHEAYLRLVGTRMDRENARGSEGGTEQNLHLSSCPVSRHPAVPTWPSRGHFFAAAAEAMRRILVEAARRKKAEKHGGQLDRVALSDIVGVDLPPEELLSLDECLEEFSRTDPQAAQLVKLHCFAGLTIEQAAELLGISARTAYRDWAYARGWLFRAIEGGRPGAAG